MKSLTYKIIFILLLILSCFADSFAQNVKVDAQGNYVAVKTTSTDTAKAIPTGKTYTDTKGVIYPVYKSKTGKLYVIKTSKTSGNKYNYYLKVE